MSFVLYAKKFLKMKGVDQAPLLLACSGGPDSKALLYLLKQVHRGPLYVAHVDHGWREESVKEAEGLKKEVEGMGIPFYIRRLEKEVFGKGNWEETGRRLRLQFFAELYATLGAKALLMGHHADDRAEVVMKRLFEGASFLRIGAFQEEVFVEGMRLLRPLLPFSKKKIVHWLKKEGVTYFQDPTNSDPRFLRSRMRTSILPLLTESFGKEIASNLCFLADEAEAIRSHFATLNAPILEKGMEKELSIPDSLSAIQLRYLLKEWLEKKGISLSRAALHDAADLLIKRKIGEFISGDYRLQIKIGIISVI